MIIVLIRALLRKIYICDNCEFIEKLRVRQIASQLSNRMKVHLLRAF